VNLWQEYRSCEPLQIHPALRSRGVSDGSLARNG